MGRRAEARQYLQAMNQRWPVSPEFREIVIQTMMLTLADKTASVREKSTAAKVLLAAEKQNQTDERHSDRMQQDGNRFLAVAERLGIVPTIERIPEEPGGGDT